MLDRNGRAAELQGSAICDRSFAGTGDRPGQIEQMAIRIQRAGTLDRTHDDEIAAFGAKATGVDECRAGADLA